MKKIKLIALTAAAVLLAAGSLYAGDDTSDSFDSFDTGSGAASSAPSVTVGGEGTLDARYYADSEQDPAGDTPVSVTPSAKIDFRFDAGKADIDVKLAVSEDIIKNYQRGILDELTMRAYLGDFTLEAGSMKLVWGKGDKVHVLDNFNANDYTDFLIPDYIDRRIAEPMFRVVWNNPKDFAVHSFRIEGVYTPLMTPDRLAANGRWEPAQVSALTSAVTTAAGTDVTTALVTSQYYSTLYTEAYEDYASGGSTTLAEVAAAQSAAASYAAAYTTALSQAETLADDLYPDTEQLKYGQAGIRMTGTIGTVDTGLSYYYGHYKQASVNYDKLETYVEKYLAGTAAEDDKFLAYDRLQVFGAEAAAAAGPVNLRGEFGYYLTDDMNGTDKAVHNNSLNWVAGFDYNIPVNNMNINVQTVGQYILNNAEADDNGATDVDYNEYGIYTNDKIIVNLSDTWNHEKIKPECSVIWGIEREDFIVMPKLTVNLAGGCDVIASGMYITNFDSAEKSEFSAYQNNSFIQMSVKYTF
ncbi:MAG TPA: hypothetical protein DCL73_16135 [Treponema sp.]|nr:hypothetical protein [Treponema sp.]